jgi:signal transduction histidine kinase
MIFGFMGKKSDIGEALALSERRLRFAEKAGNVGLWDWNVLTNDSWWSSTLYRLIDHDPTDEETTFEKFMAHVHQDDVEWMTDELYAAVADKRGIDITFRIVRSSGEIRWLAAVGEVEFADDGNPLYLRGATSDITDRKLLEDKLIQFNYTLLEEVARQADERERFWNLSEEFIGRISQDGEILSANPTAMGLLSGRSLLGATATGDRTRFLKMLKDACSNRVAVRFSAALVNEIGETRNMLWSTACDDQSENLFIIGRDVTENIEEQAKLRENEARLAHAQRMGSLGELASGVAHDFNNLLVPIVTVLDLLKRRPSGDAQFDELTHGAALAAENARGLVRRILSFSKNQQLPPEKVQPAIILDDLSSLMQQLLPADVTLSVHAPGQLPEITLPPHQLELSLMNLVINARDAMPKGGKITLTASHNMDDGTLVFEIGDQGHGMDGDTIAKARQPFFTTKSKQNGTGLGLYMASRFAAQCGGELKIDSKLGVGTTVAITLPIDAVRTRKKMHNSDQSPQ